MCVESRANTNVHHSCSNSQEVKKNSKFLVYCKFSTKNFKKIFFVTEVLKHLKNQKNFFWNLFDFWGVLGLSSDPIFILHYAMPYTNLHTKFQKNRSMFVESRANTNVQRFHAQTASWRPIWISNFSQTSYIWHVVKLSNMLIHYENNRTYSYGMALYLAIFIPNMKTIGSILWPPWWSIGKIVIFSSKISPWRPSWFSLNSFPDILSHIPTPMPNLKRLHQNLQLVERER